VGKVCRSHQSSFAQFVGFPGIGDERMASTVIFGSELDHQVAPGASGAYRATAAAGLQSMLPK